MFSDSRAPAPGEQKGFKPHAPHFIPWLRNSLKPHNSSDLGLNGPYKPGPEARGSLTPLERAKGIGFFSIQGKERAKSKGGELRCNGVGMARMLPVVLRGHHILPAGLGKQREDSPARWNQSPELQPDPSGPQAGPGTGTGTGTGTQDGPGDGSTSVQDNHTFVRNHSSSLLQSQGDRTNSTVRKYGPLVAPPPPPPAPPAAPEDLNCKDGGVEEKMRKVWDYASSTTYRHRDLHSSSWQSSDTQGVTERQQGFSSSFSYIKRQSRNCQSQRDLREPPVEAFNGPLNGVIFSTEVPSRGPGCAATLRNPRKAKPSVDRIEVLGQNQTWVQYRPASEAEPPRKEGGCHRKVVRNQIKRVVDNLEHVLRALRDVQHEMKEVVQQIDYLTSSIDLDEEEPQRTAGGNSQKPPSLSSSSSSGSSSSEVTVAMAGVRRRREEPEEQRESSATLRRDRHSRRSQSPPNVPLCPLTPGPDRSRSFSRFGSALGSPPGRAQCNSYPPSSNACPDLTLSPQKSLPVRPPTPGLSPLTVNLHHPGSPGSRPHSPGPPSSSSSTSSSSSSSPSPLSPKPPPQPPALSPSVTVEHKIGSYSTPQSDHPSAGPLSPPPTPGQSASCPPTDSETVSTSHREPPRASSAGPGPSQAKPPTAQGRRGRKPPPYPHRGPSEHTKKAKEPRKAPPYPEKRRLLSTTV